MSTKSTLIAAAVILLTFVAICYFYGEGKYRSGYNDAVATLTQDSTAVTAGINWSNVISVEGNNTYILYCNDSAENLNVSVMNFYKDTIDPAITIVYPTNISYNINNGGS